MPAHLANRPVCRNCGGFPVVSIAISDRHDDGSRTLLRVVCRTCRGTGRAFSVLALVRAGR